MTQSKMDRYFNVSFNVNKFNPVEVKFDSNIEHNLELFNLLPMINACAINSLSTKATRDAICDSIILMTNMILQQLDKENDTNENSK